MMAKLNDGIFTGDFQKREIALIGDKRLCRHFYLQYYRTLSIKYMFIVDEGSASSSADNIFEKEMKIKYIPFQESLVSRQNLLLVVCCRHEKRKQYDRILFNKGFEWGEDYIDSLYITQYYRKKYDIELADKKIWIFGAGNNGKRFYEDYKDIFHICGFISNFESEKVFLGLPVIRLSDISEQSGSFIVICSDAESMMSEQLCEAGYKGNKDYCFTDTLPLSLFVGIGTCQIVRTLQILSKNNDFNRRYNMCVYMDSIYNPCDESDNRRIKAYGVFCEVVFYNSANAGTLEQRNYEFILKRFYKRADKLHMPFYYFTGQLMQATKTENDNTIRSSKLSLYIWFRGDHEINCMAKEGYSEEEILSKISDNDYWSEQEVLDHFKKELKKIEIWDRFSSFPIKAFIEENYQKELIFVDGTHFGYSLYCYLADEIAKYLNIKSIKKEEVENTKEIEVDKKSTMPVYPCVKKALGMKIKDKYRFYNIDRQEIEYLNFENYMKRYIRYVKCIQKIYEEYGTIFGF